MAQLDREIEDQDLADFVRGKYKYNATKRARLAYWIEAILTDRGISTAGLDDDGLVALARAELGRENSPPRSHSMVSPKLGRGAITEELARELPRFDFIAHYLAVVTRKKEGRALAQGKQVKHARGQWQVVSPIGVVEYETPDADRLYDYVRRGPLGWHVRKAEEFRILAHERARS